ncbi:hypothetical protein QWY85_00995 [Neolewinella lacunae]|uniref:Uncharacterized protein n=1 Tax=Neolewinella lacunae TaxID=1517758 RepID=A0A923PJ00_9BACT|nr:hypothetical protein [Neolewinella lacunae]MBC6995018.1 hypothetical protein [Neolewinella lacunae]MDN3633211.1 hypothetical protein [Neolewinella lacunae]
MLLRVAHSMLALLVLAGSVGLPVNRHFCRGELQSVAIFGKATPCHQQQQRRSVCPFHPTPVEGQEEEAKANNCCQDTHELIQTDDQEPTAKVELPASPTMVAAFPPLLLRAPTWHLRARTFALYLHYRPPPLWKDVVCDYQVFRI